MTSISTAHFISSSSAVSTSGNPNRRLHSLPSRFLPSSIEFPQSTLCRCQVSSSSRSDESGGDKRRRWDYVLQESFKNAVKRWESYVRSLPTGFPEGVNEEGLKAGDSEVGGRVEKVCWDWERWKKHFDEVDEQEKNLDVLKAQLQYAVYREEYKDAVRLQSEISAAEYNDAVTNAIKQLNSAIEDERYYEAASIRDNAGTGLIGWWAGVSEDSSNPHGRIIRITAEHGRYVARSYTSRQLVSGRSGSPLFEIYFTVGDKGEYKYQAVYLQRKNGSLKNTKNRLPGNPGSLLLAVESLDPLDSSSIEKDDLSVEEDADIDESDEDSDITEGIAGVQNLLQDMIPSVKVNVFKAVSLGKVDKDLISNVIEEIMEEKDDDEGNDGDKDAGLETAEPEDGLKTENGSEVMGDADATIDSSDEESANLSVEFVTSAIKQNLYRHPTDFVRMPATLEKLGCFSFSFSVMTDILQNDSNSKEHDTSDKVPRPPTMRPTDVITSDLSKAIASGESIPLKVLNDLGDLINIALNDDKVQQPLKGKIFFNRINLPTTLDSLNGLYISAPGMVRSGVLYLRHKFGQWHEDGKNQDTLEFYEYVEALKITGDRSVPAGEVAFRAKVGERNKLPHKGILPEEFGVVARYKGQGRLAEPGFKNPRWVDGELVILNGKYLRGVTQAPVIGFVYWAPKYHFLALFNRLYLPN